MRIGILIKDTEYRKALVERIAAYDNDIFVSIFDGSTADFSECLILTDIMPEEIGTDALGRLARRTVFLSSSYDAADADIDSERNIKCHRIFKYVSVGNLISELSLIYNEWLGRSSGRFYSARMIAVCSESDSFSSDKCMSLARQIIYRRGGSLLVVSLGYINDYGSMEAGRTNRFARLMYTVSTGRNSSAADFTHKDSYGVSVLILPQGRNPAAYLEEDELRMLITGLSSRFDTVIMDIGSCYRKENLSVIREADSVVYFENGRRVTGLDEMLGPDIAKNIHRIRLSGETEEAMAIDDCIRDIYEGGRNGTIKS